jgi:hypothetical protein
MLQQQAHFRHTSANGRRTLLCEAKSTADEVDHSSAVQTGYRDVDRARAQHAGALRKEAAPARGTHPSIVENAGVHKSPNGSPALIVAKSKSLRDLGLMLADSGQSAFLEPADQERMRGCAF